MFDRDDSPKKGQGPSSPPGTRPGSPHAGRPGQPGPRPSSPRFGPPVIGDLLQSALRGCGLGDRLDSLHKLEAWPRMVGEKIARHSQAISLEDGVLTLDADHGAWRQELTLLMPQIKDRYNREFGEGTVREIRWERRFTRGRQGDNRR
ncbi:MAG: DUF721 domain-containing protein [Candidatus Krumholzibacteriia bacterium]